MLTAVPRLADVAREPDRLDGLPVTLMPALMTELAALAVRIAARLAAAPMPRLAPAPTGDRLLTVREVALRLHRSPKWLYAHAHELPFAVLVEGQHPRFSEQGLEKYIAMQMTGSSTG